MKPHFLARYNVNRFSQEAMLLNNVKLKGRNASILVVLERFGEKRKIKSLFRVIAGKNEILQNTQCHW